MNYIPRDGGVWQSELAQSNIEINLGGDDSRPFPVNVEMSKECESQLANLLSKATDYIAKHVADSSTVSGSPEIEWIDFGLSNYGEHCEFEVYFSDATTYVLWAVRFSYHYDTGTRATTIEPVGFSRRNW